ncbi:hypothetical protein [Allosalinactinospora lopnorensis]|uniref:hypothetical protein n=1 Tax=Allosalinactinospora lopnorensis TaxID=1352348 RepID=UPI000623D3C8|nr:hypothetical protein [Allosalinactinospora lopnorensis]
MQEHDARTFRGAAIPTAIAGSVAMVAALALQGVPGLIGAFLGTLLVIAFFAVSFVTVSWAGKHSPQLMFPVALGTYVLKVVLLGLLLVLFRDAEGFEFTTFGLTAIGGSLIWVGAHMRALATDRRPIVEPVPSGEPDSAETEPGGQR